MKCKLSIKLNHWNNCTKFYEVQNILPLKPVINSMLSAVQSLYPLRTLRERAAGVEMRKLWLFKIWDEIRKTPAVGKTEIDFVLKSSLQEVLDSPCCPEPISGYE
ncbi:hypothetical protein CEXT_102871 [Caerostris extrusa]|uniref:Uncharacterized protein n=1 Tax=Caerostris extrusa TaxID=172846 RepID=A0AAV4QEN0_CAEEX|nr:hypothetical protein CEXT_102871 [Caerostris extrusa]